MSSKLGSDAWMSSNLAAVLTCAQHVEHEFVQLERASALCDEVPRHISRSFDHSIDELRRACKEWLEG